MELKQGILKLSQNNTLILRVHYDAYTIVRILRLNAPLWENPHHSSSVRNLVAIVGEDSVSLLICVFAYSIKQRLIPTTLKLEHMSSSKK